MDGQSPSPDLQLDSLAPAGRVTPARRARETLEAEITELWGHLNAATCRFLELIAEFDRTEGWAYHGCASCAQWLNLECGIGPVAAREKVRVARALEALPKISAAFRAGQHSYSKVRAITRVATAATEATLLNVAIHGTATHVERLVRRYRRIERSEASRRANDRHRDRFLHVVYNDDESVTIHGRLPVEIGALIEKAIEAATEQLGQDRLSAANAAPTEDAGDTAGAKRADALRLIAEQFLENEAERCRSSAERYQVVVHIDQAALASEANPVGDKCRSHAGECRGNGRCEFNGPEETSGRSEINGRSEIADRSPIAVETARRLACDGNLVGILESTDGEPLNVGRRTRAISPALRRALRSRDDGCRFPGCDRTRYTQGHHVRHWADGGETSLANLVTLCGFHHRLVHEGEFGLRATGSGAFIFTRPDGSRIEAGQRPFTPDHETLRGGGPEALQSGARCFSGNIIELIAEHGIDVRPPPGWHGETMDYGIAIERMLWEERLNSTSSLRSG